MASNNPLEHVIQHPITQIEGDLGFLTPAHKITVLSDQILMMIVAGLLLTLFVPMLVRRRAGNDAIGRLVPTGWANFFEAICQYLRKEVAEPVLGEHTDRFIRYVWSAFFFVLTVNVLGLLPVPLLSRYVGFHVGGTAHRQHLGHRDARRADARDDGHRTACASAAWPTSSTSALVRSGSRRFSCRSSSSACWPRPSPSPSVSSPT